MNEHNRSIAMTFLVRTALLLFVLVSPSIAQSQTVRIFSGFPPGGAVDALARIFAERISENLARPVIVETRAGAGGLLAAQAVKAATPDGSTLLVAPEGIMVLYPHTVSKPVLNTLVDFIPVAHLGGYPLGLAVGAAVPAKDLKEYVAWAQRAPANLTYATAGAGTALHFFGLLIGQSTGIPMVHVAYKGVGPAIADAVGGQVPAVVLPLGTLLQQAKAGKLRILAHSGARRSDAAPAVPTFRELGYPIESSGWFGLFAPANTPSAVTSRLNGIVIQAMRTDAVRAKVQALDLEIAEMTPAELSSKLKTEYDRWGPIIKGSGFNADSN
jgi:tripartite-type tricarboxylate transporter receptor subunit TctC